MATLRQRNTPAELSSLQTTNLTSRLKPTKIVTKTYIAPSSATDSTTSPISSNLKNQTPGNKATVLSKVNFPPKNATVKSTGAQTPSRASSKANMTPTTIRLPKTPPSATSGKFSIDSPTTKKSSIPSTPTRDKESVSTQLHKSTPVRIVTGNNDSPTHGAQLPSPGKSPKSPFSQKIDVSSVKSRVGSLDNIKHSPKGSDVKIFSAKPDFSNVKSRVGSLDNINHTKKGVVSDDDSGQVKIFSKKMDFSSVNSRVGSLDNINHQPKGGDNQIFSKKMDFSSVHSRVGSLDNINHKPKGGDNQIFSKKMDFSSVNSRVGSLDNINHQPKGGDNQIFSKKMDFSSVNSRVGSLDNINHKPKGGDNQIFSSPVKFTSVKSRVGSLDNINHQPKGGDTPIYSSPVKFTSVKPRVGSLDNIKHKPSGGDVIIFDQKLNFRKTATPKVDAGRSPSLDDERLSPISSLALDDSDDVLETNSPEGLMSPTPFRVALSPIAEISQIHQEEEAEQIETLSAVAAEIVSTEVQHEDEKTTVVKGKHAPTTPEPNEAEKPAEPVVTPVDESGELSSKLLTPQTVKARIAMLEAKKAMAAAKKAAAREEAINATIAANKNSAENFREEFPQESAIESEAGGEQELQDGDDTAESQADDIEPTFEVSNTAQLRDVDLSFEVNVARQSILLAEAQKVDAVEPLYVPKVSSVVEVPPETQVVPVEPELTLVQQDAYNSSWI